MDSSDLIRMANQIADFYRPYPRGEAVAGIAEHIRNFWDPRMRKALSEIVASKSQGLDELALEGAVNALAMH
ncbi:MAG: formate dehydrogenase subunit delta [Rhizobiaceae bacterium]